jgi:hypothetical protein
MRALAERLIALAALLLFAASGGSAFAQPAEAPEEITVEGGKTLGGIGSSSSAPGLRFSGASTRGTAAATPT